MRRRGHRSKGQGGEKGEGDAAQGEGRGGTTNTAPGQQQNKSQPGLYESFLLQYPVLGNSLQVR